MDGVSRFITPAMRNRVTLKGIIYEAAVAPDVRCDLNKGNHSVRGGSQGWNLVTPSEGGQKRQRSTKDRLKSPQIRLGDGTLKSLPWARLHKLVARLVIEATGMEKTDEGKVEVKAPEALGAKVFEYQYLENTYAVTKLFYSAIGTPNVAYHDRAGAAGSSPGLKDAGMRPHDFSYDEVRGCDVLAFFGTNPYENQSVFFMQYCLGKEMVVVDPRKTATARYAESTGGLSLQFPALAADTLLIHSVAREILVNWMNSNRLEDFPWSKRIFSEHEELEGESLRRRSRAMNFDEFTKFLRVIDDNGDIDKESPYDPINVGSYVAKVTGNPEDAGRVTEQIRALAGRLHPVDEQGKPRRIGIFYEKGLIWGFNYHNTAAIANLGLLLGAYSEDGGFVGRVGGHQKGWANSLDDLSDYFVSDLNGGKYDEGYPKRNATDRYTDDLLGSSVLTVHHNLDNHVFGPPVEEIDTRAELPGSCFVELKNGLATKCEPDVKLLWIIGGNYLGQTNDAERKREILDKRLAAGGADPAKVSRPDLNDFENDDKLFEIYRKRLRADGGLVAIQQDIFANPTSEKCDILIPAAGWGEDSFCRYNAQRRLKLYQRFQDPPLYDPDEQGLDGKSDLEQMREWANWTEGDELDPYDYLGDADRQAELHSPKPDWMIIRDIGRQILNEVEAEELAREVFPWENSGQVADEMAIHSHRGLAAAKKEKNNTGKSLLGDIYLFGKYRRGLTNSIFHGVLGLDGDDGFSTHLTNTPNAETLYTVSKLSSAAKVENKSAIYGNGLATNGVLLPVTAVGADGANLKDPVDVNIEASEVARGEKIERIRGTLSIRRGGPLNFVKVRWFDSDQHVEEAFRRVNEPAENQVWVTNGRVNHLWNNMFHHIRNEYVNERYPEDMPGTLLEIGRSTADRMSLKNGQLVEANSGDQGFRAIISVQENSFPSGGMFAMFSYPVQNEEHSFKGYVNNVTDRYMDGINPIGAVKFGRVELKPINPDGSEGVHIWNSGTGRAGPSYEDRGDIVPASDNKQKRIEWAMREMVVMKGLPRAFVVRDHRQRKEQFHSPDLMLAELAEHFKDFSPEEIEEMFIQNMTLPRRWKRPPVKTTPLIDEWQNFEYQTVREFFENLGQLHPPDQPDVPRPPLPDQTTPEEGAFVDVIRRIVQDDSPASRHAGIEYPDTPNSLDQLFDESIEGNGNFALLLKVLKTKNSSREGEPTFRLRLVTPGNPGESVFLNLISSDTGDPMQVRSMARKFTDADREVVRAWIASLPAE